MHLCVPGRMWLSHASLYPRGWYNASGFYQENIVTADVKTPDGMTFDWVSQLLYWSDTAMTHIQVKSYIFKLYLIEI